MTGELAEKTPDMKRKGRVFRRIMRGLSWSPEVRANVPESLWAHPDIADGWRSGPLIKSMSGIADPDLPGVSWTAWVFQKGPIFVRSTAMAATTFLSLWDIANDARANPGDTPTEGL